MGKVQVVHPYFAHLFEDPVVIVGQGTDAVREDAGWVVLGLVGGVEPLAGVSGHILVHVRRLHILMILSVSV